MNELLRRFVILCMRQVHPALATHGIDEATATMETDMPELRSHFRHSPYASGKDLRKGLCLSAGLVPGKGEARGVRHCADGESSGRSSPDSYER
jgi:hypothetical protein